MSDSSTSDPGLVIVQFPLFRSDFISVILDSPTHTLGRADENDGGGFHLDHELNGAQPFGYGIFGRNVKGKNKTKIELKNNSKKQDDQRGELNDPCQVG